MKYLMEFEPIIKKSSSLSPHTFSGLAGVCEYLAEPRSKEELAALFKTCHTNKIPFRILGNGCNLLVRSAVVPGVVVKLTNP
ncbi:MAG: FAD-binding protein, partial [Gemmataceae bacterium]|nr:FAD-binding protein [Gemmataceae bacterium]